MPTALDGTRVVEFGSNLGAAYAAMLLAEQGARAIRVEPRAGTRERGTPHYHVLNRSKRRLTLEAGTPEARPQVDALLRWADVVITGFTPARLAAIGLDYDSIARVNPRALALNVPPMGSRGPESEFDADDDLVAARSGITGDQWARSGNPVALVFPAASYSAGVMGAIAAAAALYARADRNPNRGQQLEVSLLAAALSLQTGAIIRHEKATGLHHGAQDPWARFPATACSRRATAAICSWPAAT